MKTFSRVQVYDMDGTIVCSLHRYRTVIGADNIERIDLPYWRENEYRAGDDSLLPLAEQYRQDLQDENCYVIIATARVLNSPDRKFIREILGQPDAIISRAANDSRSGGLLKVLGLKKYYQAFQSADWTFYEDNAVYMKTVCDYFNIRGVYIPSKQGH